VIVTDDYPCISLPHLVARAAAQVDVRLEAVDSNGLIPLAAAPQAYPSAAHFRRFVQRTLRSQLSAVPSTDPLADLPPRLGALPADVLERWPSADPQLLQGNASVLATLPIDHEVPPVTIRGGFEAAKRALRGFVRDRLASYGETQRHPDARGTSRLSPYLHFGHLSAHEVFDAVMRHERWNLGRLSGKSTGARDGWWGVGAGAEAFLDQVVVWRELALNTCAKRPDDYASFEGLPSWAQATLEAHSDDPRPFSYDLRTFERAETHDPVWNAAQREMLRDGWMHNYMRMLWGKKILEWSPTPRVALETMTALMNRWALDGRDPNSYAGYMWTLGRYDRPWPERPIYGTVRSMSSDSAVRKVRLKAYLARNGGERSLFEV
jgi:deoxyribodipyrimidine photo-lyase